MKITNVCFKPEKVDIGTSAYQMLWFINPEEYFKENIINLLYNDESVGKITKLYEYRGILLFEGIITNDEFKKIYNEFDCYFNLIGSATLNPENKYSLIQIFNIKASVAIGEENENN